MCRLQNLKQELRTQAMLTRRLPAVLNKLHTRCADKSSRLVVRAQRNSASVTQSHVTSAGTYRHASTHAEKGFLLTLERTVGSIIGADTDLAATGAFGAHVFPDLPAATTWANLWKSLRSTAAPSPAETSQNADVNPGTLKVVTVAANLRDKKKLESRMVAAVGGGSEVGGRGADALLLVTGSHPLRTLPGTRRFLPTSLTTLDLATRLKAQGRLPPTTQLWVVANPNTERDAALVAEKVVRGAGVVITQPPLNPGAYAAWLADAERRGVCGGGGGGATLVMGHPWITSATNAAFWGALAGCVHSKALQELVQRLSAAEAADRKAGKAKGQKGRMDELCAEYNAQLVQKVLGEWGGLVGGMHIMPLSGKARKGVAAAVEPGGALYEAIVAAGRGK